MKKMQIDSSLFDQQLCEDSFEVISRLEDKFLEPDRFHSKYGFNVLVNVYNQIGACICNDRGKIAKIHYRESEKVVDWYVKAGKHIRIHYSKGVNKD
jgi:hypothetical protein